MFTDTTNFGGGTARWMVRFILIKPTKKSHLPIWKAPELLLDEVGAEPADRSRPADVYALGMVRTMCDCLLSGC